MGLSIHYSGYIIEKRLIDPLIEELTDILKALEWQAHYFDGNNDDNLKGICFATKECEPVFLTFLPDGRICSPVSLMTKEIYDGAQFDKELMYVTSAKTQYAGPHAHIAIIKLLKYISSKYLKDFKLDDEGLYWETGDESILFARFKEYNFLLDAVGDALSNLKSMPGETTISLVERIERILEVKLKKTVSNHNLD